MNFNNCSVFEINRWSTVCLQIRMMMVLCICWPCVCCYSVQFSNSVTITTHIRVSSMVCDEHVADMMNSICHRIHVISGQWKSWDVNVAINSGCNEQSNGTQWANNDNWVNEPTGWTRQLGERDNWVNDTTGWTNQLGEQDNWVNETTGWTRQLGEQDNLVKRLHISSL